MPSGLKEPKTTRPCPKPEYANPNNPTEEEQAQYREVVEKWVLENAEVDPSGESGCWNWTGAFAPNSGGARYNNFAAHAFVYRVLRGEYEGNLLRRCKNKNCVNPDHAYPAVGARTKQKQELKKIIQNGEVVLKEEGRKQVIEGIKGGVMEEVERVVKAEVRRMEKEIVEGVVAKLIEVRFDEMVARAVRGGK